MPPHDKDTADDHDPTGYAASRAVLGGLELGGDADVPDREARAFPQITEWVRPKPDPRRNARIFDPLEVFDQIRCIQGDVALDEAQPHLSNEEQTRLEKLRWLSEQQPFRPKLYGDAAMRHELAELRERTPSFNRVTDLVDRAVALSIMADAPLCIPPLVLVGPPGVGKTHYSKALAQVLRTPVHAWSCATNSDAMQLITGHPTSWRGCRMGMLTEALVGSASASPVVLLDELDKFQTHRDEQPYNVLLDILEIENSRALLDEYLRVRFDVSNIVFVATANDASLLPDFIVDRLLVIEIAAPTAKGLQTIAKQIAGKLIGDLGAPFSAPGDDVIAALALRNPRGIARIVKLALGFAAAETRTELTVADVAAAEDVASSAPSRSPIGFLSEVASTRSMQEGSGPENEKSREKGRGGSRGRRTPNEP